MFVAANPAMEKFPGEQTASYIKRIYPKIKLFMEQNSQEEARKRRKKPKKKKSFLYSLFGLEPSDEDNGKVVRHLFLLDAFNNSLFGHLSTENTGSSQKSTCPSITGLIVIVLLLMI